MNQNVADEDSLDILSYFSLAPDLFPENAIALIELVVTGACENGLSGPLVDFPNFCKKTRPLFEAVCFEKQMKDESESVEITRILHAAGQGDLDAKERLIARVYEDLKRTAARLMQWEPHQTLQATALVNEAYLRLFEQSDFAAAPNRAYFFAAAGQAMRRILVEAARRRKSIKRGGHVQRQPLDEILDQFEAQNIDFSDLNEALSQLEKLSPRQANVVHLRWFMEFSVQEVSELLNVSVSTIEQDWRSAQAFLKRQILLSDNE